MADRRAAILFAAVLALAACVSLSLAVAPAPAREGKAGPAVASGGTPRDFPEHHAAASPSASGKDAQVEPAPIQAPAVAAAPRVPAPAAPAPQAPVPPTPEPQAPEDPKPAAKPGQPAKAAIDPRLAAPTNLVALYEYRGTGFPKVDLSWSKVTANDFDTYELLKWNDGAFQDMVAVFYQLAALNEAALRYARDFESQVALSGKPGLMYDEREAIIAAMQSDIDALFAILAATPGTGTLWDRMVGLTVLRVDEKQNKYMDKLNTGTDLDRYFLYTVLARYRNGNTSPPSNCDMVFSYNDDRVPPPAPTGFAATAYDPGVELVWIAVPRTDIAGYDVYEVQSGTPVKLNSQLVKATEYFYPAGAPGVTYQVVAITYLNYRSSPASAVSVLAPATVYTCDDPAWTYTGQWYRENYTALEPGGRVIKVSYLAGSRAQISFTGRRVKLYAAKYWSCGNARIYVDGVDQGTFSLYSYDVAWQQQVFVITGLAKGVPHTITVECLGSGGPEGFNFVNVDYVEVR